MSAATVAFPPVDTPAGVAQYLWRAIRLKVANGDITALSMKPAAGDEPLHFHLTLLDGTPLAVTVSIAAAVSNGAVNGSKK